MRQPTSLLAEAENTADLTLRSTPALTGPLRDLYLEYTYAGDTRGNRVICQF